MWLRGHVGSRSRYATLCHPILVDILVVGATCEATIPEASSDLKHRLFLQASHGFLPHIGIGSRARRPLRGKADELISCLSLPSSVSVQTFSVDVRDTVSIEAIYVSSLPRLDRVTLVVCRLHARTHKQISLVAGKERPY